ncbi:MAG TPA: DNA polymerase III subunit alpha [Planctomycetota bacterium]|nr:DNA polymerase III subunit alpha [Planctomycetota bacterium]
MADPDFVHLHVHSEYSLLDGANRIPSLVEACVADGQRALALTDHGNMFGIVQLYREATRAGIKPLLGCEMYIARQSRHLPHSKAKGNGYNHLTLLARNEEGFANLKKLATAAYLEGLHFRPRIDRELLAQHTAGISCLSGCLSSEFSQLCGMGKESEAEDLAMSFRDMFGPEHFWLELQRNGIELQDTVNEAMVRIHGRTGIPMVATNDVHYLRREDCDAQDVLLCINTQAKRDEPGRFKFDTNTLFFASRAEMADMFRDLPETLKATAEVAEQIDFEMKFGEYHLPIFAPENGKTADEVFDELLEEGLGRLYGRDHREARERLESEKRVIRELGFVSYFLIVWDLIRWARDHDISVGPGRGSAAGSIVAYLLDITRVCPLRYGLLFERFLNSARVSMPDIDIDFCKDGRERVLQYTRDRYGEENVAQIVTFGTMKSRTVVRDVGRVLEVPLKDVDRIAKNIPQGPGAPNLSAALSSDPELKEFSKQPEFSELFELSITLEGITRHVSTHAAGVVIADRPIAEYVPLAKNGDDVTTQWQAPELEDLGLLKMDYLGLRTLTIIDGTLANVTRRGGSAPEIETLPLDDAATFALLLSGETQGVFQLESDGMRKLITRLKPDCFEDLIAILALYRPGPLESGMADMFCRRKHGEEPIVYPHPSTEQILKDTYGCIVYQEQVMLISNNLANFSLNEADNLRKAMGKKKPEIMERFSTTFLEGAQKNGCERSVAQDVWDNMVKFGGYGFNKSHSTAYALISYQTAYLKAHHRADFMAANLTCEMGDSDKVKLLCDDARGAGIAILPPAIESSNWGFETEGKGIRFGMGAVKGTGSKAIEALVDAREAVANAGLPPTLNELCRQADPSAVGRVAWEALIKAGAFDAGGHNRGAVLHTLGAALADGARAAEDRRAGQGDLFALAQATGEAVREEARDGIDDRQAWDSADTLRAEYEAIGFYLSGHPLEDRAGLMAMLSTVPTNELERLSDGAQVSLAGLIVGLSQVLVKTGKLAGRKMARFRLEDLHGAVNVICFPRTFEECAGDLEDGAVVVARGKLETDGEEPTLILSELMTVEAALGRFEGSVVLSLTPEDTALLPRIKQILSEHRGKRHVYLQVTGTDGSVRRVRAGGDCTVTITAELTSEVDKVLGRGRMKLARL